MRRFGLLLFLFAALVAGAQNAGPTNAQIDWQQTNWIDSALREMETIKVGMTRSQLMVVFTTEGGISTPSQRTYVYRKCPTIKVDVKFAAEDSRGEMDTDKITSISRPYLGWSVTD